MVCSSSFLIKDIWMKLLISLFSKSDRKGCNWWLCKSRSWWNNWQFSKWILRCSIIFSSVIENSVFTQNPCEQVMCNFKWVLHNDCFQQWWQAIIINTWSGPQMFSSFSITSSSDFWNILWCYPQQVLQNVFHSLLNTPVLLRALDQYLVHNHNCPHFLQDIHHCHYCTHFLLLQ